jgi:hypothetical protein
MSDDMSSYLGGIVGEGTKIGRSRYAAEIIDHFIIMIIIDQYSINDIDQLIMMI